MLTLRRCKFAVRSFRSKRTVGLATIQKTIPAKLVRRILSFIAEEAF